MNQFRVALSGDFRKPDGTHAFPSFDLGALAGEGDVTFEYVEPVDMRMRAEDLASFDALILLAARFDRDSIPAGGRLKIVARFGVGYDTVDVDACTQAGIAVAITPDGVRRPVATGVMTLMLALASRLMDKDRITRLGPEGWAQRSAHIGIGLTGRTLGQLGLGNIGAEVVRLAKPFDMRLVSHDPFVTAEQARGLGVELVDLDTLFQQSDFISISVPLSDKTRGLVDARLLGLMRPTAYLINTARGSVVDQAALYDALKSRRIGGAGLDVFREEPTAAGEPLLTLDNVIVTPHALCWTDECFAGIGGSAIRAVLAVKRGERPQSLVNGAELLRRAR
jgi:phosphoglycerate dehydrogenase-like enzyme